MSDGTFAREYLKRRSFIELSARDRAKCLFDSGTERELAGPFDRIESPWLFIQDVTPQADDGCIVMRGTIGGQQAVVIAIAGAFQGGSQTHCGARPGLSRQRKGYSHERGIAAGNGRRSPARGKPRPGCGGGNYCIHYFPAETRASHRCHRRDRWLLRRHVPGRRRLQLLGDDTRSASWTERPGGD
jgi:hypothetical protein